MDIRLEKVKIVRFLSLFALALIMIHTVILVIYYVVGDPDKFDFVRMFDLDMERNVPTTFSTLLFAISALCFYLLSKSKSEIEEKKSRYWLGLSVVFIYLGFDESAKIHEKIGDFTEQFVDASGYLYYPWVLSYGLLVLILGVTYAKFFWKMEKKIFLSFMGSATIFLTGAVFFDMLGGKEANLHGTETKLYSLLYTIEESMEMYGVIFLIWILLTLLEKKHVEFKS